MKLSNLKFLNDISKLKFFKNITMDELQELNNLGAFSEKNFPKGDIIFHTGDVVSKMGIVIKGQVFIEMIYGVIEVFLVLLKKDRLLQNPMVTLNHLCW